MTLTYVLLVYMCVVIAAGILRYGRMLRSVVVRDPVITPATYDQRVTPAPSVSVVIPARNEKENIRGCLESVLAQDYPNFDVTVVDDRSEDRTAEIAEEFAARDRRVRLIRNRELPEGWTGRNHALHLGTLDAPGEFLLFLDADTVHDPRNLSQTVTCAVTENIDMLSLIGRLKDSTFWQKVMHPVAAVLLMVQYPLSEVNDPKSKKAFANGQYVLIRRKVYDAVGGRAAVRSAFVDLALAGNVKDAGFRLRVAHSGEQLSQTWGPRTLRGIWRMWVRVYLGVFHHSGRKILAALFREVFLFLVPFLLFLGLAASVATGHGTPMLWTVFALSAAVVAGQHAMGVVSYRLADADLRYLALALPAGFILAGILFHAWVTLVFNRSVEWKGRRVRPGGGAPPSP
jgi:cellulose synthase/poly-beta-1,6-N-acetylglucosamine synthase-like glycosyltransferase